MSKHITDRLKLLHFLFTFIGVQIAYCQDYSYTQYTTKDGLPASTVHGITQDHYGFLWFSTEAGLSRFDGKVFRTFTIADGLPSNAVLFSFCDSRNRIWIGTFKNAVCYYYNGKIYNHDNDSLLKKMKPSCRMSGVGETIEGRILMNFDDSIYLLSAYPESSVAFIGKNESLPQRQIFNLRKGTGQLPMLALPYKIWYHRNVGIQVGLTTRTDRSPKQFALSTGNSIEIVTSDTTPSYYIYFQDLMVNKFYSDSVFILGNSARGVKFYDFKNRKFIREYLPKRRVQDVFEDKDKNLWFSTKGAGVFKLNQQPFVNYTFGSQERPVSVYEIYLKNNQIHVITEKGTYWRFAPLRKTNANAPLPFFYPVRDNGGQQRLKMQEGKLMHYYDAQLKELLGPTKGLIPEMMVKTAFYYNDTLLISTLNGVSLYAIKKHKIVANLLRSRATCAIKIKDTIYIGSLEGLYMYYSGKLRYMGDQSQQLRARISTIVAGNDGIVWIGTNEEGVIGMRHGKIIKVLNQETIGLSNNACRCLFLDGRYLWIGTEYGINKVDLSTPKPDVIRKYDMTDGLQSNNVNTIYIDGSMVYVGSPEGITCFDEDKVPIHGSCKVLFTNIMVANKPVDQGTGLIQAIEHSNNSIRFEYAGLSFVSSGGLTYHYRLLGLNDQWNTTEQMYVDYPSLPSGKYTFQIQAINKLGDESTLLERNFEIKPLLWERTGIRLLIGAGLIAVIGLFFHLKSRSVQRKEKEQQLLQKRIATLEQKALRAQMNPHFIFNCLNSIQHFILTNDARGANFYLGRFAGLVRSTLEHASEMYIPLSVELDYLLRYLDLEQMQASPPFKYAITVDPNLEVGAVIIPNMLIQPFVENAIKHGVSKLAGDGVITLEFKKNVDTKTIQCIVTDNGPGICYSNKHLNHSHSSKGISISRERIDILNQVLEEGEITLNIEHSTNEKTKKHGTKIILAIPLLYCQ